MHTHSYTFLVLKYQHSSFAREQLNAAVLLVCPSLSFAKVKVRRSWKRFSDAFPGFDRSAVKSDFEAIERTVATVLREGDELPLLTSNKELSAKRIMNHIFGVAENSLVWDNQGSGVTNDPEQELIQLYERLIGRFDDVAEHKRRDDDDVFRGFAEHLEGTKVLKHLTEHTLSSPIGDVKFKKSFKNGIWHCVQPLSFDMASKSNIDGKAAQWAGHLIAAQASKEKFRPYFILGEPNDKSLHRAFKSAKQLLEVAPCEPTVVLESHAVSVADKFIGLASSSVH